MRRTSKSLICLGLSCLSFVVAFSSAVRAQEAKQVNPRLNELKQKRLETLVKLREDVTRLSRSVPEEGETVREVFGELFAAQREQAKTREERIKICEDEVKQAEEQLQRAIHRKRITTERITQQELLWQAYLLKAQITLENAREDNQDRLAVKKLQATRLEILGKAYDAMKKDIIPARVFYPEAIREITATYFGAQREYAETQEERIRFIEEEVNEEEKLLDDAKSKNLAKRLSMFYVHKYQLDLLVTQITLDNAKAEKQITPAVRELQAKRLDALKETYDTVMSSYTSPNYSSETFRDASAKYFAVRLIQAETNEQRIKICEEEVQQAEKLFEFKKERMAAARAAPSAVLMSEVYAIDAQIRLENAKAGE